jgi:hypothetical protein
VVFQFATPERNLPAIRLSLDDFNPGVSAEPRNPIPFNNAASTNFACQPGKCNSFRPFVLVPETGETYSYCGATYFGEDFVKFTENCTTEFCGPVCPIADSNNIMARFDGFGASGVGVDGLTYVVDVSIEMRTTFYHPLPSLALA